MLFVNIDRKFESAIESNLDAGRGAVGMRCDRDREWRIPWEPGR